MVRCFFAAVSSKALFLALLSILVVACKKAPETDRRPPVSFPVGDTDLAGVDFVRHSPPSAPGTAPLRSWMQQQFGGTWPGSRVTNFVPAFILLEQMKPEDMPNWPSIARDGRRAAEQGDDLAVRAACRACHESYGASYANKLRSAPLAAP